MSSATKGVHPFSAWLVTSKSKVGKHWLLVLTERTASRTSNLKGLRDLVRGHYVDPKNTARRIASLGAPKTAALLRIHVPKGKTARSGDLGEIFATELAEQELEYEVPIRRLRWKDGREMALRGDDIIGIKHDKGEILLLKGESKSRATLSTTVLDEAGEALDREKGMPNRHSVLFVAERLSEMGRDKPAKELEQAVLESFRGIPVAHMLFILTAGPPNNLLETHLKSIERRKRIRHALGLQITDHAKFIALLFGGL